MHKELRNAALVLGAVFATTLAMPILALFLGPPGYWLGLLSFGLLLFYIALRENRISAARFGRLRDAPPAPITKTPRIVNIIILAVLVVIVVLPWLILRFVYG